MKTVFLINTLLISIHLTEAYDNFQGFGRLTRPCFDVYDHTNECKRTLLESYNPPNQGTARNPATTFFFLFTPKSQNKAEQLHQCSGGLPPHSTFDNNCPTEIFIHGNADGLCRSAWMRETKDQLYLKSSCYNVILIDWTWGNFPFNSANTSIVGHQVAYVLKKIARQRNYECSKFHITAHSYGCKVAHYAGEFMRKNCKLGRLTGLEVPFSPNSSEKETVNPTDATFVDVIHTNSGACIPFNIGEYKALGHVDFYVNDGTFQPSCYPYALISFLKLDLIDAVGTLVYPALCSHVQALQYYKVSILANTDDTQLIGVRCNSREEWLKGECKRDCEKEGNCLPMGLDTPLYIDYRNLSIDPNERRIYYVPTTLTCPYSDHSKFTGLPLNPVSKERPN